MARSFHLEKMKILTLSISVGHNYLQYAEPQWSVRHAVQDHIFIRQRDWNLKDAAAFAYSSSLKAKVFGSSEETSGQRSISNEESDNESSNGPEMDKWMLEASDIADA